MKRVLFPFWIPDEVKEKYSDRVEVVRVEEPMGSLSGDALYAAVADAHAVVFQGSRAVIDAGRKLEAICSFGAGYDAIDIAYAGARGIKVCNAPCATTQATAELTVAILLALSRRILNHNRYLRLAGSCRKGGGFFCLPFDDAAPAVCAHGKTLGVVGFGRIGKAVAEKARGLGMKVLYHDLVRAAPEDELRLGASYVGFEELLASADYVTLHCLYTAENHHLMNREAFSRMKPGAFFINAARGPLMDEAALIEALKNNHLAGAALDVFEAEPAITPELIDMDQVLLVPHIGTSAYDTRCEMACEVLDNLTSILEGQDIPYIVNREYLK